MGKPETSITEVEVGGELEKGEVPHIWEEDVNVPRWMNTRTRTYYYKVPPQYLSDFKDTH
jgi:hypothetical protein